VGEDLGTVDRRLSIDDTIAAQRPAASTAPSPAR